VEQAPGQRPRPRPRPADDAEGRTHLYIGKRQAALKMWFGENLETTTLIELGPR